MLRSAHVIILIKLVLFRSVVLTTEENNAIKDSGYQNKMPEGWEFFKDNIFARYKDSSLLEDDPSRRIKVYGQVCR